MRVLLQYGVSQSEIGLFISGSQLVADFLGKYKDKPATFEKYSRGLCMFFKWLREVKGLKLGPEQFLDLLAEKRASRRAVELNWGKSLALQFSRDNVDLETRSDSTKLTSYLTPLKRFCEDCEVPLYTEQSVMGVVRRKFSEPAYTVELAKKVLAVLNQRDRAVCMCMLQSGQSIHQVLVDLNLQCEYVLGQIKQGRERIRVDFAERKGNNFPYHSFLSVDAITEVEKWLPKREQIIRGTGKGSELLFITELGDACMPKKWLVEYTHIMQRHGLWTGPLSVRSHMFRKIFQSEASPPDRGISKEYVAFMMGHCSGTEVIKKQDMPGGVYDNAPRIYLDVVEREYQKLEPYLNVYSGKSGAGGALDELSSEDVAELRKLLDYAKQGKIRFT